MMPAQPVQLDELKLFIDGKSVDACCGRTFESQNPWTGTAWARLADGGPRASTRPWRRPAPRSRAAREPSS
jgi:acyl-CoA reductase-like NAD-dependent aldehyde dehydrogenase